DIHKIDWLKIDIEGAELEALAGAQRTLETYRPKVIIEVAAAHLERAGHSPQSIFAFWEQLGYHIFEITEDGATMRLTNPQRIAEVDGLNLLCTPAEKPHDASVTN
ncbi:MAG: FkbM family methyltransferase, partial [Anaerolineae bacterium]|nr:FkbM family methyltransferase [Anaerolineae bacterium]